MQPSSRKLLFLTVGIFVLLKYALSNTGKPWLPVTASLPTQCKNLGAAQPARVSGSWGKSPRSVAMATCQVQAWLLVMLGVGNAHPWGFWEGLRQRLDCRCLFLENVSGFIKALCRLLRLAAVPPQVTMSLCSTTWRTFLQTRMLSCTKLAC